MYPRLVDLELTTWLRMTLNFRSTSQEVVSQACATQPSLCSTGEGPRALYLLGKHYPLSHVPSPSPRLHRSVLEQRTVALNTLRRVEYSWVIGGKVLSRP